MANQTRKSNKVGRIEISKGIYKGDFDSHAYSIIFWFLSPLIKKEIIEKEKRIKWISSDTHKEIDFRWLLFLHIKKRNM